MNNNDNNNDNDDNNCNSNNHDNNDINSSALGPRNSTHKHIEHYSNTQATLSLCSNNIKQYRGQ